jgi:hypothetical protein
MLYYVEFRYAECRILLIIMLIVIVLSIVMLNVVAHKTASQTYYNRYFGGGTLSSKLLLHFRSYFFG